MTGLTFREHPLGFLHRLEGEFGTDLSVEFSRYFYRPQSLFDERFVFQCSIQDVGLKWMEQQVAELPAEWELALNSRVLNARGRAAHIGMIDFVGRPDVSLIQNRVRDFVGAKQAARLVLYDSGRSIHGYILELMSPGNWTRFLGRLLLMNVPGEPVLVDTRWIGHRLIAGYAALRWSANSSHHSEVPALIAGLQP